MTDKVTMNSRGVITIPRKMRELYGLKDQDQLLIEDTPQGLLLRPTVSIPIEIYTDERIAEFLSWEEELAPLLDKLDAIDPLP